MTSTDTFHLFNSNDTYKLNYYIINANKNPPGTMIYTYIFNFNFQFELNTLCISSTISCFSENLPVTTTQPVVISKRTWKTQQKKSKYNEQSNNKHMANLIVTAMIESPGAIKLYTYHRSSESTGTICV